MQAGLGLGQVGLLGNEIELADFEIGADGGGEAALGNVGSLVAEHAVVTGVGQPHIVLGVEGDLRDEDAAGTEGDVLLGGLAEGIVGDAGIEAELADAEIGNQLIGGGIEGLAEAQDAIVAAIGDVEVALVHGESGRSGEAGGERGARTVGAGGIEVALADDEVGLGSVAEAGGVLPGEDAVIAGIGDVDPRGGDGRVERHAVRAVQLASFHQVGV